MHTTATTRTDDARERDLLLARANSCKLLAACFYPPDHQLLSASGLIADLTAQLAMVCPSAAGQMTPLPASMGPEQRHSLGVAYTRLFTGPPTVLSPPHACFYLDSTPGVMGPTSVAMMKYYRAKGLALDNDFPEMPDHIAVVLEFLYYLLFREAAMLDSGTADEQQRSAENRATFVSQYVRSWVPRFCKLIIAADQHPFYNGLARCLKRFVEHGLDPEAMESA